MAIRIKELLKKLDFSTGEFHHSEAFKEELKRQCNTVSIPIMVMAIFSWPVFILLDTDIFPEIPLIVYFRWGFTIVGALSLLANAYSPSLKKHNHLFVYFIIFYLELSTAIILGLVGGHPSYMGGYALVMIICALPPIPRSHSLFHILLSLIVFQFVGGLHNMKFVSATEIYGLFNIIVAVIMSIVTIFGLDKVRQSIFEKNRLLKIANDDLQKANELKNQLLKVAAHDLKDPLQVIIGYADLLQIKYKTDKFADEKLKIIYRSTDRMIKLVGRLLDIAAIEHGRLVMQKNAVDISEVVDATVITHQPTAEKKNQKIYSTTEKKCLIYGDRMLIRQIVSHLIDNAIKFSYPGKSIWIEVGRFGESVILKVIDEGPGLTQEEAARMFGKFQRLTPKPTAREISTGLGLSITKELVELNDGSIRVEAELEKGTTIIVEFPVKKE